mgnify:CR=1 FL=1
MGRYFSDGIFKRKMAGYAVIFLTVVNVVLIAVTYIAAKKKDINTYAEG